MRKTVTTHHRSTNEMRSTGGKLMRLAYSLIFAGALFVASPALAQDNAAAPANTVATNGADANAVGTVPAETAPPAAVPGDQAAAVPPGADTTTDTATAPEHKRGFPWGVLGLIGLVALLGARKAKG